MPLSQSQPVLAVEDLVKVYPSRAGKGETRAVSGMSFEVRRGEIFGLLGPNGAGKTTTLKILTTLLRPTSGRAHVMGFDVLARPLDVRRAVAMVLQETAVELFLTVRDNLVTYAKFHGQTLAEAQQRAGGVLEKFHLSDQVHQKVQDLSGGLRRRVQVAKVFMVDTPVLFLDEFSTGMDPILKRAVIGYLREEAARGRTIVLTTQIMTEAEELCDNILIMNKGKAIAQGDLNALKLLAKNVYDVTLTFEKLSPEIQAALQALDPQKLTADHNTVEMTLKAEESRILETIAALAGEARLLHVEISGASLEDIFVDLTRD
jgi:ABC-2 type transport system ATP-binding protein